MSSRPHEREYSFLRVVQSPCASKEVPGERPCRRVARVDLHRPGDGRRDLGGGGQGQGHVLEDARVSPGDLPDGIVSLVRQVETDDVRLARKEVQGLGPYHLARLVESRDSAPGLEAVRVAVLTHR